MQITPYGSVLADVTGGRIVGLVENDGMKIFRGVPYAAAPYGANRFREPRPVEPWDGERDATTFGPSTYQIEPLFRGHGFNYRSIMGPGWRPGDETLNLNIWTPGEAGDDLPVLVHIHGGAFLTGNGGLPAYDGRHLAERGAVYVSIHYRTGTEGFAAFEGAATNRGLRDQIAALTWVQENIAVFGGDPGRVMVHGESAGGMSIALLLASPAADGLFHRAIIQSGSSPMAEGPERAADRARRIAEALGLAPTAEALSAVDQRTLLDTALPALAEHHDDQWGTLALGPWIDDDIVPVDLDAAESDDHLEELGSEPLGLLVLLGHNVGEGLVVAGRGLDGVVGRHHSHHSAHGEHWEDDYDHGDHHPDAGGPPAHHAPVLDHRLPNAQPRTGRSARP